MPAKEASPKTPKSPKHPYTQTCPLAHFILGHTNFAYHLPFRNSYSHCSERPPHIHPTFTPPRAPSCIAPIPCASRALLLPRRFRTLRPLHRPPSRAGSLARPASVSLPFLEAQVAAVLSLLQLPVLCHWSDYGCSFTLLESKAIKLRMHCAACVSPLACLRLFGHMLHPSTPARDQFSLH